VEVALIEEVVGVDTCGWEWSAQWWRSARDQASEISGPLDLLILGAGDLLDKINDGSSKLWVWNLHESLGEPESVRRGEIVRYILRRRCVDV
jgi:hypothetical protein